MKLIVVSLSWVRVEYLCWCDESTLGRPLGARELLAFDPSTHERAI